MRVGKNTVVTVQYTLKDDDGDVIDSSRGGEPLTYLHGEGMILLGLEAALDGKALGDSLQVSLAAGQAYGERDPELMHVASRSQFGGVEHVEVGMRFRADRGGESMVMTVVAVEQNQITLDGNHPLAGVALHFDLEVVGLREATPAELEHGHPHDPDHPHGHEDEHEDEHADEDEG